MIEFTVKITETKPPEVCIEYHCDKEAGTENELKVAGVVQTELNAAFDKVRDMMSEEGSVEDIHGPTNIVKPAIEGMKNRKEEPPENPRFGLQ